jgi:light-regulated signal transduction histidine kinase (bacteriophytochrome)
LRAPLRAVDGFALAAIEDFGSSLPEEGQRQLQVISDSAQKMGELIDDLLAFSRLSRQPLNKQTVTTESLVRDALKEICGGQADQKAEIKIGELPPCEGDRALLKQVWVNLLSNALKYSRNRERPVIEIGYIKQGEEQVFFVKDNGSGFDMCYADKLFGVFQRLHREEEYEGTGVGLAIVQRIVRRHGGRVWAEAAIDRGAAFYFTLNGGPSP